MPDDDLRERQRAELRKILNSATPRISSPPSDISGSAIILSDVRARDIHIHSPALKSKPARRGGKPPGWREVLLDAIRQRAGELALTEDQLCELARFELKREFVSVDSLSRSELDRVYRLLHVLRRPAL